jgi:endonuclease YncB( thermonuclease family)
LSGWRTRIGGGGLAIAVLITAALIFIIVNVINDRASALVDTSRGSEFHCTVTSVNDGDGPINCAETDAEGKPVAVRLRGIDAREIDNSCQVRVCPRVSGAQARAVLMRLAVGRLECRSFGPSFNRVDASCRNPLGADISCEMVGRAVAGI